jgi:polysaccharide export outer membrane protein
MIKILALAAAVWLIQPGNVLAQDTPPDPVHQPSRDLYVIAVQDVLNITVWDHADLTGRFTVLSDGAITLPILPHIAAAGLTVSEFEKALTRSLADGLIRNPQVFVSLDRYRARQIFVFGNVVAPGTYTLAESESLVQALAKAGYGSASEAVIVRPKHPSGPTLPDHAGDADVIRLNLRDFEKDVERGSLERNVVLRDGDTIFVPRSDPTRVFVSGQVRNPGAYSIAEGTTVLQALTLAGGPTEEAAVNRLRIIRIDKGKQITIKAKLSDVMQPGDTLLVPERFL